MAPDDSLADSTDWLSTPLSAVAPLESSLRCQVCKDFFNTPMITSCSHTFCSLCIRRYLSQEGRCPACRQNDSESKLRRNWVVEELVTNFKTSRRDLLDFARNVGKKDEIEGQRPQKRRKIDQPAKDAEKGRDDLKIPTRSTRSQSRKTEVEASQESRFTTNEIPDSDSEYDDELERSTHFPEAAAEPADGLVACPGCGRRMKAEAVFTHLDTCTSTPGEVGSPQKANSIAYTQPSEMKQKERLPTLSYSMLSDNALRKKLKELGISNQGPKILMQKRHTEWVNLWNANCDSRVPRSKRELLNELEIWERTQGRQIANNLGPSGVMSKDFDGDAYVKNNKSDFDDLIRKAREKARAKKSDAGEQELKSAPQDAPDTAKPMERIPESPVRNVNGYVDLTSSTDPEPPQLQHSCSQGHNITA